MSRIVPISILVILLYFVFYTHLGRPPVRLWDESRLIGNAYSMYENNNYIVTYYDGRPDDWNLKPPFLIWCQSTMMKIFGPNEFAFRFPCATFGFFTSIMLLVFCWKFLDKFWMGIFAALVLATTRGYIDEHGVRFGEYEAPLIFFMTLYGLMFLLYFKFRKPKYLYVAAIAMTLAVLTKGVAGLFLTPVIAATCFFFPPVKNILTSRHLYFSIGIFLLFGVGYYFLREHFNPGYIKNVFDNEITGRYNSTVEQHVGGFWMYYDRIKDFFLLHYLYLIPCGFVCGILATDSWTKQVMTYVSTCALFLYLLLSSSKTKLDWYIYPVFPFLALIIAYFVWLIFKIISELDVRRFMKYNVLPYAFIFIVFLPPYRSMIDRTYLAPEYPWNVRVYSIGYYFQNLVSGREKLTDPLKYVYSEFHFHMDFYTNLLKKKNINVEYVDLDKLKPGDLVLCSIEKDEEYIKQHYNAEKVRDDNTRFFYRIH
jgi:4-amino-4-deoxy-L-arabinose transferase-like glycosyltransferase